MKNLILISTVFLLLLTFKGIGQDSQLKFGDLIDSLTMVDDYNILPKSYYEPCLKMSEFIEYWKIYKQECYNDSTISYYWLYSDMGSYWKVLCNKGEKDIIGNDCPEHVEHKQPDAEGFLNWLLKYYQK